MVAEPVEEEEEEDQVGLVAGLLLYYDRYVVEFIQGLCDSRSPSLSNSLPPWSIFELCGKMEK